MKLATSFALFALTSAAMDDGSAAAAGAQTQDAGYGADQGGSDQGYQADQGDQGDQAEGYEADQGYEAPAAAWSAPPVKSCFGNCPSHAHCVHKETGACIAPVASYEAPSQYFANDNQYSNAVAAPASTYDSQGRRLQQSYGQGQQQESYAPAAQESYAPAAQESYAPAAQESYAPAQESYAPQHSSCPPGTVNMNCRRLGSRVVLWVAFGCLFAPALYFFALAFGDKAALDAVLNWGTSKHFLGATDALKAVNAIRLSRFISGVICFIASLAYLTMALGYGYTTRCCDGRQFYYARYIDWAITTPLMIWKIIERTTCGDHERYFLIAMDILMIVAGLIGSLVCGSNKWAFFGFSMLCFIPVMYYICQFKDQLKNDDFKRSYENAVNLTILVWCGYPIVWILSEGTGTICAQAEAICYTVLDIIAKSGLGLILASRHALWKDAASDIINSSSML